MSGAEGRRYEWTSEKPRTHLIIPDSHCHPRYDNERYERLGRLILDIKPDVVIDLGDGPDMPSLSAYDKGTKSGEGLRVQTDLEHWEEANRLLWGAVDAYNAMRKRNKQRPYSSLRIRLGGNHDQGRLLKWMAANPEHWRDDAIEFYFKPAEMGWEYVPFLKTAVVDGVAYQHFFSSGLMGRPIGGEHIAASLIKKNYRSSVCGHSHVLDYAQRAPKEAPRIFGMSAGAYYHPDYAQQAWCQAQSHMWWNGVIVLEGVWDGFWTKRKQEIPAEEIARLYP